MKQCKNCGTLHELKNCPKCGSEKFILFEDESVKVKKDIYVNKPIIHIKK
jgi:RNA polymerase subunit RPABC4/transcription elongation factor Spt4